MDLVLKILPFYLLAFWWFVIIFYKLTKLDKENNKLHLLAHKIRSKPLRLLAAGLTDCEFCIESWFGFIGSAVLVYAVEDYAFFLYAPIGASFSNIIKRVSRW